MYMQIKQLLNQGFSKVKIADKLGVSRSTVYRYIERNPDTMAKWMKSSKVRRKILDDYKSIILTWLTEHPDMSAAQIMDWLLEKYEGLTVAESTVRNYVRELRKAYDIPKETISRSYGAVPEKPMGAQMQVDFGQTKQLTSDGKQVKLYCAAFVLSTSRQKYMEWLDRPFTTRDVIRCHENAFKYYGGIPGELVYDQDALILVSENSGDLILTREFQSYKEERNLNLYVCRKADPETKGKIENVIKYIKNNFAKYRRYYGLDSWNEEGWKWLERTGNHKEHNTTKKRPVDVFAVEKQHLRPISSPIEGYFDNNNSSITRTVRKDNTIWYKSNRYSVPLGTFNQMKDVFIKITDDTHLLIIVPETGELLAKHSIETTKGNLIQDSNHVRDCTIGIDDYITKVAEEFTEKEVAINYLNEIRKLRSRYIRDQLQLIDKQIPNYTQEVIDQALEVCISSSLYSATEFSDVIKHLDRQCDATVASQNIKDINPLHTSSDSHYQTSVYKSDVQEYLSVLEGER